VAVESDALFRSARAAGYAPEGYLYPTPITRRHGTPDAQRGRGRGPEAPFTVLLTGSLDAQRRDYDLLAHALAALKAAGMAVRVVVGGHCLVPGAQALLEKLQRSADSVDAKALLTDPELDVALAQADAVVCLNRPEFYGEIKGSGAIGDAFYAGKRLLIDERLAAGGSADARFYLPFGSAADLADHLLKSRSDPGYLCVDAAVLDEQASYFSGLVRKWLLL
jgi:hypothetical protein